MKHAAKIVAKGIGIAIALELAYSFGKGHILGMCACYNMGQDCAKALIEDFGQSKDPFHRVMVLNAKSFITQNSKD